jgi:putative ubiquitin-RnfH superfamily antitoxin RatB of RatAB toxin-antitoxin module
MVINRTQHIIQVEVVYALADQQWLLSVELPLGSTVKTAIQQSGLLRQEPEQNWDNLSFGIFSRQCSLDTPVRHGDRVEIYRPLQIDPKERRRRRAGQGNAKAVEGHQSEQVTHPRNAG